MEKSLIIELDGLIHEQQKIYDQEREEELQSLGFTVLRFTNDDILNSIDMVLQKIKAKIVPLSPKACG
jgi:very-short-patch-repair endonuclease